MKKLNDIYAKLFPQLDEEELYFLPTARDILSSAYYTEPIDHKDIKLIAQTCQDQGLNSAFIQIKDKLIEIECYKSVEDGFYYLDHECYYVEPVEVTHTEYRRIKE